MTGLLSLHDAPTQWHELATLRNFWLTLPGMVCGVGLLVMVMRVRHYLAMPLSLLAIPLGFYAVLLGGGIELEQLAVRETPFFAPLLYQIRSFYQYRLGTTIGEIENQRRFLPGHQLHPGLDRTATNGGATAFLDGVAAVLQPRVLVGAAVALSDVAQHVLCGGVRLVP